MLGQTWEEVEIVQLPVVEVPRLQVVWPRSSVAVEDSEQFQHVSWIVFEGYIRDNEKNSEFGFSCKLNLHFAAGMMCQTPMSGSMAWMKNKVLIGNPVPSDPYKKEVIAPAMASIAAQIRRGVK
jgi:hypothetical protein